VALPVSADDQTGYGAAWKWALPLTLGGLLIVAGLFFGLIAERMITRHESLPDAVIKQIVNVAPPQQVFGKNRVYVLLLGIDYDYSNADQPSSTNARSDTIMAAGIDFPSKAMKIVSVLRDTEVMIGQREAKINSAYALGGEPMADRVVGEFLGLPSLPDGEHFDKYIVVKINAVKDFVNAIGGIDVPVTERMDYDDRWGHLHIHFKPGLVHMSGEDAQAYARFRHDACSDPCRTKRQQQVIRIVMEKLKHDGFNDLTHVAQVINVFRRDVATNLTVEELKSLGWAFKDANTADLGHADTIGYVDTKPTRDGEVVIPDEAQKRRLITGLLGAYVAATQRPVTPR
jgi:polyisoprenyl-teichoic acid--peptidoglycan teichoic acid transferase